MQGLSFLGTDQALNLQSQAVNIGADLEGGRLVSLNFSQSEDGKNSTLTHQRTVFSLLTNHRSALLEVLHDA